MTGLQFREKSVPSQFENKKMYKRQVFKILILASVIASGAARCAAQDAIPAHAISIIPMERIFMPDHLYAGQAVDLDNPASYLYP